MSDDKQNDPAKVVGLGTLNFSPFGVFCLVNGGANIAQVAAAMNTSCAVVRQHLYRAISVLAERACVTDLELRCTQAHKIVPLLVKHISSRTGMSWIDLIDEREFVELLETRAYFRAFRNSSVHIQEKQYGNL